MVTLDCDLNSVCGPIDDRVIRVLEQRYGMELDPAYLNHVRHQHGIPRIQSVTDARGVTHRLGRFLPLIDSHSELEPPFRRSWEFPARDARIDWAILTLLEEEGPTAQGLFGGERLLPFASLYQGSKHPDALSVGGGSVNLLAFDYESGTERPRVVVWLAEAAQREYDRWGNALRDGLWEAPVQYAAFTVPAAAHFDDLLGRLGERPAR